MINILYDCNVALATMKCISLILFFLKSIFWICYNLYTEGVISLLLQVENVKKCYGNKNILTKVLDNLSLKVDRGEFICIMGASGSGKTTLLNCISTIDRVSSGNIYLNDINVSELHDSELAKFRREQLGFVFQESKLLSTLTIEENIALPLTISGLDPALIPERVSVIAKEFGIEGILKKYPYEVSGGEKQRSAAARAIVNNPSLLLADEPTGALDSRSARILMEMLSKINKQLHTTIVLVTHDPVSASYANRVLFLKDGSIYNQINKGNRTFQFFYQQILDVLSAMGGEANA